MGLYLQIRHLSKIYFVSPKSVLEVEDMNNGENLKSPEEPVPAEAEQSDTSLIYCTMHTSFWWSV